MKNTLNHQNQKGAAMIILALIVATLMAITIVGISQLTVSKKKNSKSLDASETAYQKADEAAECALWGRKAALETGSSTAVDITGYKMFAKNITDYYCDKYSTVTKLYKQLDPSPEETLPCASPLLAANIFTEGSEIISNNFSDNSTKKRGVGATVSVVASSLIEPFVACNKLAEYGIVKAAVSNLGGCNLSSVNSATEIGWLADWPECSSVCFSDSNNCAYYDTSLDDGKANLYADTRQQGARWCWTKPLNITDVEVGTMCYCLDQNKTNATDVSYWNHPDVVTQEFCHPCKRLYDPAGGWGNNACGGGGKVGQICQAAWSLNPQINASVWGAGGRPSAQANAGILDGNNCYSCHCPAFQAANPTWCASCP